MRMCEMSFSEFSESVDTRFDPQFSAVLEEMRLRTDFNTLIAQILMIQLAILAPPAKRFGQIAAIIYSNFRCLITLCVFLVTM